jgi:dihydrodipicolinate synthase/N-acetylneuraminate lyase
MSPTMLMSRGQMGATVISAIPTAFLEWGGLDLPGTARIAEHALRGGVDALLVNGTTGEFPSLSRVERQSSLEAVLGVAGPQRVIAHVGASSAHEAEAMAREAWAAGATTLAAITPYFLPATEQGVHQYFAAVRRAAPNAKLFAYLFPERTNVAVSPSFLARLIRDLDLAGAKLSIPGVAFVTELVSLLPADRAVYSGNDGLILEVHAVGGAGVVSGVSSAVPETIVGLACDVQSASLRRDEAKRRVDNAVSLLGPSIGRLKSALVMQGVISSAACRMSIDPTSAAIMAEISALLEEGASVSQSARANASHGGSGR